MSLHKLKSIYRTLLSPAFGELLRIDDSDEDKDWIAVMLDGEREEFFVSLYGTDCARLFWCNECFIFDRRRDSLVSSDTFGEIVYERPFSEEELPHLIQSLVLRLKDCTYLQKEERVVGRTPSGWDKIRDYTILAKSPAPAKERWQLGNITIEFH